jgi:hypothetical protein
MRPDSKAKPTALILTEYLGFFENPENFFHLLDDIPGLFHN